MQNDATKFSVIFFPAKAKAIVANFLLSSLNKQKDQFSVNVINYSDVFNSRWGKKNPLIDGHCCATRKGSVSSSSFNTDSKP